MLAAVLALPATARAAGPPKPYFDAHARQAAPPLTAAMRSLKQRLGAQAVVDVDAQTGTPRMLARLDGTLSARESGGATAIALGYVRSHLDALGLTGADVDALEPPTAVRAPDGVTTVRWRQAYDGVPAGDSELRVNVTTDGSVLSVLGSPAHDLRVASTVPALDAGEAVRAVQADTGAYRSEPVARGPAGATRRTVYADGTTAALELFDRRLAWHVSYRAASDAAGCPTARRT